MFLLEFEAGAVPIFFDISPNEQNQHLLLHTDDQHNFENNFEFLNCDRELFPFEETPGISDMFDIDSLDCF